MSGVTAAVRAPAATAAASGVALVIAATLCFAGMDTLVRLAGATTPVLLMLTVRYAVQAVSMVPVLAWRRSGRGRGFRPASVRFQLVRGSLLLASSVMAFFALQHLPVPEFTAVLMMSPVLVTVLAATVLHEHVQPLRWVLVVGAFVGALIVLRPGSGLFGWAALLPVCCACTVALFHIVTRQSAGREDPFTTHFWTGAVGCASIVPLLASGHVVDWLGGTGARDWLMMLLIGALGTGGHLLLILGLTRAPASRLMPFIYVQIAGAVLFAWWLLGHWPDTWGWVGMAIIAACGAATAALNLRGHPEPVRTLANAATE